MRSRVHECSVPQVGGYHAPAPLTVVLIDESRCQASISPNTYGEAVLVEEITNAIPRCPESDSAAGRTLARAALTFWNIQGRHEVDFLIEVDRDTLAVEIEAASRFDDRSLAGLRAFLGSTPRCRAGVLAYNGGQVVKIEDRLWAVPLRRALM